MKNPDRDFLFSGFLITSPQCETYHNLRINCNADLKVGPKTKINKINLTTLKILTMILCPQVLAVYMMMRFYRNQNYLNVKIQSHAMYFIFCSLPFLSYILNTAFVLLL